MHQRNVAEYFTLVYYACLYMGRKEDQFRGSYTGLTPELYKRYIDDGMGATTIPRADLEKYIEAFNMSLGSVDITYEISETSIAFLDVVFCISGDRITSCIYYKPTDSHSYLRYDSHHPKACRDNIPFSQFLRLRRNCSGDADFNRESSRMAQFFADRGYPPEIVNRARIRASAIERQESLRSRESVTSSKIPLVLPYNQIHCKISGIIHWNSKILSKDP